MDEIALRLFNTSRCVAFAAAALKLVIPRDAVESRRLTGASQNHVGCNPIFFIIASVNFISSVKPRT